MHSVELLSLLDALVLLSSNQLDYITREEGFASTAWRHAPVAIIPNGVSVGPPPDAETRMSARTLLGLGADQPIVGCVAAFRREKDHETLLRAFVRIAARHPDAALVLVGNGPREHAVRALAADLGIDAQITYAGFRTDVDRLLPAFDVFCLTSIQETYPVSVLEAMAAALPVVMTRCEGVPELVVEGRTGWTAPVGGSEEIARLVLDLLDDDPQRIEMGRMGHLRAEREFSFDTTLARYAQLFRTLLGDTTETGLQVTRASLRRTEDAGTPDEKEPLMPETLLGLLREDLRRYPGSGARRLLSVLPRQGFWAVATYRVGHRVSALRGPAALPLKAACKVLRKVTEILTGIEIAPEATIGPGLYVGHFGGITVTPHAVIGRRCNLSQGVTIGVDGIGERRGAPRIGDEVYIGPGAKVFGKITIGNGVAIGANAVVGTDVPHGVTVAGVPARVVSDRGSAGRIEIAPTPDDRSSD